jgi:hypothetical protein
VKAASALTQLAGQAAFEHFDCRPIGRVRKIIADDLGRLALRGVVELEDRAAGRLKEAVARFQPPMVVSSAVVRLNQSRLASRVGWRAQGIPRNGARSAKGGIAQRIRVPWKGTVLERVKVPPGKGRSGR